MSTRSTSTGIVVLVALAAIAALLLSMADDVTREQRARNQALYEARLLGEVIPGGDYDEQPGLQTRAIQDEELLGTAATLQAWPLFRDGNAVGVIVSAIAPDGYVAPLKILVGVSNEGVITGVRVTEHRETPGLGDAVDASKSDWIRNFDGLQLADTDSWALQRDGGDFDHISGATITSRAVVQAVQNALMYIAANRDALLAPAESSAEPSSRSSAESSAKN